MRDLEHTKERPGFIPRQPRFAVITDEDGGPAPARRPEVIEEMRREEAAIEELLARVSES